MKKNYKIAIVLTILICVFTIITVLAREETPEEINQNGLSGFSTEDETQDDSSQSESNIEKVTSMSEMLIWRENIRANMIKNGELAADTPRITLEQAKEIANEPEIEKLYIEKGVPFDYWEMGTLIANRFNEIVGAPDYDTEFYMRNCYLYGIDDICSEVIQVNKRNGCVYHFIFRKDGNLVVENLSEVYKKQEERRQALAEQEQAKTQAEKESVYMSYYDILKNEENAKFENSQLRTFQISSLNKGYRIKALLKEMGELKEDTPMLTINQVKEICSDETIVNLRLKAYQNYDDRFEFSNALLTKLNAIAGAPDVIHQNSGGETCAYFLNEQQTEYILVLTHEVIYSFIDSSGNRTSEPLFSLPEIK